MMLRSETEWFPVFMSMCKQSNTFWNKNDMDHELMHQVANCDSWRKVSEIIENCGETAFWEQIITYKDRAQRRVDHSLLQHGIPWYSDTPRIRERLIQHPAYPFRKLQ